MKKKNGQKNLVIVALFFFLLGGFITLISTLLNKRFILFLGGLFFVIIYVIYDKYVVKILGWETVWWSPHSKKIELIEEEIKKLDPEVDLITYFVNNKFKTYYKIEKKWGFELGGNTKEVIIKAKYKNNNLKINFYPYLSKKTMKEMVKFKKYLNKYISK